MAPNLFAKRDKSDLTEVYNTQLSPEEERRFRAWATKLNKLGDLYDYDLRGFWKSGEAFAGNGHGSDRWKKPNHPTFSTESVYARDYAPGGSWVESMAPNEGHIFVATPQNLKYRSEEELRNYFNEFEPNVRLVLPARNPFAK